MLGHCIIVHNVLFSIDLERVINMKTIVNYPSCKIIIIKKITVVKRNS